MPEITQQQLSELQQDEDYMRKANLPQSDIDSYRQERLANWGVALPTMGTTGQEGLSGAKLAAKMILPAVGAVAGGAAVPAAVERYAPAAVSRLIPHFVSSGVGQALGTTAGELLTGTPPKQALTSGAIAGGLGGGTEAVLEGAGRLAAATTSVPESAVRETVKKGVIGRARTMIGRPNEMAERTLGLGLQRRLAEMRANISPGRLTKVAIRDAAEQAGVQVPLADLHQAIDEGVMNAGIAEGRANVTAQSRLSSLKAGLNKKFASGSMTPKQADAQLQAFQRDADMAAARGNPFLAQTYRSLKDKLRTSFFDAVDRAVPGSDIAKATGEARKYLSSIDTLEQFTNDKTPETFVRGLFSGDEKAQSALQALRDFEGQAGTGGTLEREIHDLALKRAWTGSESGRAFSLWRALEKIVAKPLAKTALIASRPGGQAAAASAAFFNAMNNP